ncbi:MAG TPA: PAS domain S-box protein [Acidimicrobiales bacterium]|nr:PAS domain S-box protein [Acidimicrobiales bacterium]
MGSRTGVLVAETLEADPASVGHARRLITAVLTASGHDDLVEVASLLVSEVVTNSLLHAGTQIRLGCTHHGGGVRIEVSDRSTLLPSVRHYDPLATTGRGLGLVSMLASSWGVNAHDDGKTLWFELGDDTDDDRPPPPPAGDSSEAPAATLTIQLRNASPPLLLATVEQGEALLRELALLALGGELDDTLPYQWHVPEFDVAPILATAQAALVDHGPDADLDVSVSTDAPAAGLDRLRLIDCADALARDGRMLSAPALPEIAACRHWLYSQIAEQAAGYPPQRWELPERLDAARVAAVLSAAELERLGKVTDPTVVADDANRVIFVNQAAAEVLGWDAEALVGQRLTVLIPPELRQAHLAGFSRLQVTGEERILGSAVRVPALRRDGSSVDIDLTITRLAAAGGRSAFCALLAPTSDEGGARLA